MDWRDSVLSAPRHPEEWRDSVLSALRYPGDWRDLVLSTPHVPCELVGLSPFNPPGTIGTGRTYPSRQIFFYIYVLHDTWIRRALKKDEAEHKAPR